MRDEHSETLKGNMLMTVIMIIICVYCAWHTQSVNSFIGIWNLVQMG